MNLCKINRCGFSGILEIYFFLIMAKILIPISSLFEKYDLNKEEIKTKNSKTNVF
jgi:hypothetical protein